MRRMFWWQTAFIIDSCFYCTSSFPTLCWSHSWCRRWNYNAIKTKFGNDWLSFFQYFLGKILKKVLWKCIRLQVICFEINGKISFLETKFFVLFFHNYLDFMNWIISMIKCMKWHSFIEQIMKFKSFQSPQLRAKK